ncbi:MAG: hypothetical protein JKY17_09535 [Magnetovibrio sp.]|nr:hypothetical protein [Magnetovibrio sp.]
MVFSESDSIIFDFWGKPDTRILDIAKSVDLIIIPIHYQSQNELKLTIQNINAFKEHNSNIIVVINNCSPSDAKEARLVFSTVIPNVRIFEISHSKFIRRLANENQTVFEVSEQSKVDASLLNKKIIPQIEEILKYAKIY